MNIVPARPGDVAEASQCLAAAFAADPLIHYFFRTHLQGVREASVQFFSLLLRVRIALGMPALMLEEDGALLGTAMGYDTRRPVWPEDYRREWRALESLTPGAAGRFETYETIADAFRPAGPHHYLGVIGVHPSARGIGAGRALLDGMCSLSRADPLSTGVYLETASADSLEFYYRNGFSLRGEGDLDGAPLWCVFRPN